jgi:hypothetical protein
MMLGKTLIEYLKSLSEKCKYVDIVPEKERPYNKEFVKEIKETMKTEGKFIKLEDLWK